MSFSGAAEGFRCAAESAYSQLRRMHLDQDLSVVPQVFHSTAMILNPDGSTVSGIDAISVMLIDWWRTQQVIELSFDLEVLQQTDESTGFDIGRYVLTMRNVEGTVEREVGRHLVIWIKSGECWQIRCDIAQVLMSA